MGFCYFRHAKSESMPESAEISPINIKPPYTEINPERIIRKVEMNNIIEDKSGL